ncbi:hypothetical protein B0A55_00443 [Friedmanniomyces simplex]|uniref:PQ loop repeat protein n=1 Tax=Friedmanniomyces simplex TaxID=329884 RepID=A0A4U0Y021_9PEZI|nr:hypothetical protein B0A55_00443 [Friedmanniomyces simplex]
MTPSTTSHCQHLAHPSPFTTALAAVLLLGILVSYLPQHLKILSCRSSEGLSPWWVLLGALSSVAALGNILTLPASREDVGCCKEIGRGECAAALLGVGQIGCQWACFMFIVMLFLIFFPSTSTTADLSSSTSSLTSSPPPKRRDAVIVATATVLALLLVGITSVALVAAYPHHTQAWANLLGTVAGLLAAIQYVPQIWYTYRLGDVKSLSVVTMLIQVPGAFLFAFSLWQRVGWEGWSTWAVYVVTGILQGNLLALAIIYYMRHRRMAKSFTDDDGDVFTGVDDVDGATARAEDADERTALLNGRGNGNSSGTQRKSRPIANGTHTSNASQRQLSMLYAATPPEHDSDRS